MRIEQVSSLAIVVDVQERLLPHIAEYERVLSRVQVVVRGLRTVGVPLMVTEQYPKGLGATVPTVIESLCEPLSEAAAPGEFEPLEKIAFSCFDDAGIAAQITKAAPRALILCGIETHVCVAQTALDALHAGIVPVIVADAVGSRAAYDHETALQRLRADGAVVTTSEALLFELLRFAGTDQFRAMSKLVK